MTDLQISLLKQCALGLNVKTLSEQETETLLWLAGKGLCGPQSGELSSTVYVLTPEDTHNLRISCPPLTSKGGLSFSFHPSGSPLCACIAFEST